MWSLELELWAICVCYNCPTVFVDTTRAELRSARPGETLAKGKDIAGMLCAVQGDLSVCTETSNTRRMFVSLSMQLSRITHPGQ